MYVLSLVVSFPYIGLQSYLARSKNSSPSHKHKVNISGKDGEFLLEARKESVIGHLSLGNENSILTLNPRTQIGIINVREGELAALIDGNNVSQFRSYDSVERKLVDLPPDDKEATLIKEHVTGQAEACKQIGITDPT